MRQASTSMLDLQNLLLTHEARLQVNLSSASVSSAHFTTTQALKPDNSTSEVFFASRSSSHLSNYSSSTKAHTGQFPQNNFRGYRGRGGY
jgi:hypothetical protein